MELKDYWGCCLDNPNATTGCGGDLHSAFVATLARAKKLGADHVVMTDYAPVVNITATPMQLDLARVQISATEMAFIGQAAANAGLAVHLLLQMPNADEQGHAFPQDPTTDFISNLTDVYVPFLEAQAAQAQQDGFTGLMLNWQVYVPNWTDALEDVYSSKLAAALVDVRASLAAPSSSMTRSSAPPATSRRSSRESIGSKSRCRCGPPPRRIRR